MKHKMKYFVTNNIWKYFLADLKLGLRRVETNSSAEERDFLHTHHSVLVSVTPDISQSLCFYRLKMIF